MAKSDFYLGFSIDSVTTKTDGTIQVGKMTTDPNRPVEEEVMLMKAAFEGISGMNTPQVHATAAVYAPPSPVLECTGLTLSDAIETYCKEAAITNCWKESYAKQVNESLHRLVDVLGDQKVSSLTRNNAVNFFDILQKLPPNIKKNATFRNCTIEQILKMKYSKKLDPKTVKDNMSRIRAFSKWLKTHNHTDMDLFLDLDVNNLRKRKRASKSLKRERFSMEDLVKIFTNRVFTNHDFSNPYMFWLPLIALFSGMRLNEICQLRPEDFLTVDEILLMNIKEDFDEDDEEYKQTVKNESSRRIVPVHPKLIELGLCDYLATRNIGTVIFDGLKEYDGRLSHYPSKWFNDRFREEIDLTEWGKVFHSFRHTAIDELKQKRVDLYIIKALVGHARDLKEVETKDITFEDYGKDYLPCTLLETLSLLNFDEPLSGIKKWTGNWKKTKRANDKKTDIGTKVEPQLDFSG